ncbi:MAG: DUF4435 domain-containing protein, partial [Alphaproteobacteria bacterium]|nr:DUF4435 domain-containing protein [Alphaproteobacteria bacterium]
ENVGIMQLFASGMLNSNDVAVFVEGPDDVEFYYDFIAAYFPGREAHYFGCGGKNGVLAASKFFSSYVLAERPFRMLYICDRDFQPLTGNFMEGVFYTDGYSIESYFANSAYVQYVLNKYAQNSMGKRAKNAFLSAVDASLNNAAARCLGPMALACCLRMRGIEFDFDHLAAWNLFDNDGDTIRPRRNRLSVMAHQLGVDCGEVSSGELLRVARTFSGLQYRTWIRGKFAIQLIKMVVKHCAKRTADDAKIRHIMNFFGREALRNSKAFLGDIDKLREYSVRTVAPEVFPA